MDAAVISATILIVTAVEWWRAAYVTRESSFQ